MASPDQDEERGRLIPRSLYTTGYREMLCEMILDAVALGVVIPGDMPVDTEEHIQAAIVFVARLTGKYARGRNMPLW